MERIKGFKNCLVLCEDGLARTDLLIEGERIAALGSLDCPGLEELEEGRIIVPGFIDQHIHGAAGGDIIDGSTEAVATVAGALAKEGTTGFLATTTTHSSAQLNKSLSAVKAYMDAAPEEGAEVLGVHLEGPFISEAFLGAQLPEYAVAPSLEVFKRYERASGDSIRLVSMAVEAEGAEALADYLVSKGIVVSIGHSDAGYDCVERAVGRGATCVTHTYNAQRPLHHREVGVVGAAMLLDELYCEAICDGIHLSAPAVRLLWKNKPHDKLVLITDALRSKYLPDGTYQEPGDQTVVVKNGEARLENGTLAGSVLKMNAAIKNAMEMSGADLASAVRCATENPAKCLGMFDEMGSIRTGKLANLAIIDRELNIYKTVRRGKVIYSNGK